MGVTYKAEALTPPTIVGSIEIPHTPGIFLAPKIKIGGVRHLEYSLHSKNFELIN